MIQFEVGETYVSSTDNRLYKVLRRTKNTITVQDNTGHGYKRYLNARYTEAFQCEWISIDSIVSLNALDKYTIDKYRGKKMDRTVAILTVAILETTVAVFAIVAFMVYAFMQFTGTPDVIFSWETKQCVKVINADGTDGDCNNLPEKYTHIWGK